MRLASVLAILGVLGAPAMLGAASIERRSDAIVLSGKTYTVAFAARDGSIVAVEQKGKGGPVLTGGEQGLWHVRFGDGSEANASGFGAGSPERSFRCEADEAAQALRMAYDGPDLAVTVAVTAGADALDFAGEVLPKGKVVLEFALPGRLRFSPGQLERFVCPASGNSSVGTAFLPAFFKEQPQDRPSGWERSVAGPKGYRTLYGGLLVQRDDNDPPTALRVTAEGREWLGPALAGRVDGAQAVVNRPPARQQADLVLVDSANGPYFSASHLGGKGLAWRLGGAVRETEQANALDMTMAAIERLAKDGGKLGLIALRGGPQSGGWALVPVRGWLARFRRLAPRTEVRELATPAEMMAALGSGDFLAILNPYGEWIPVPEGGVEAVVDAVGRYVRAGGNWFEVGGYPFFYGLRPVRFAHYGTTYPPGFADFLHLDTRAGSASVYGVQPHRWPPWAGAARKEAIFVPGRLACGGDERGGWCDRPFATWVAAGQTWRSPTVRLAVGHAAPDDLRAYCEANQINRRLADKMPPAVLEKLKKSVLVYYSGSCREKLASLGLLPVPTLVHFADYLKGGFDKEYPDHLPPRPGFGTPQELRELFDRCHELGHLVMPYTNPTWWCDEPKGPTFLREGDAPLLRTLDGKLSHERYAANVGFTVCHWHPAVQAANRRTVRQFTQDFPVDILFQDQCGARGWCYDTNTASPTPYAYSDGLISMVDEDSRKVPLSTESGWDRVVNYESQLCGMTWAIVPTEGGSSWRRLMKLDYPPETWVVFPLAQYIAHDKAAMVHHDLGQFVTNPEVLAWTLGLGFCMSDRVAAASLGNEATRHWLLWLDRLQKSVCARYVGEPVAAFEHDRGPRPGLEDDGVIRATYGPVAVVANLGPVPRREGGRPLAPFGFHAAAPGMVAGSSFVVDGGSAWLYGAPEEEVDLELPERVSGNISLAFDGAGAVAARAQDGVLRVRLPARPGRERVQPPAALAGKAPRDWPGERPAIGILDLKTPPVWTRITAEDWFRAFSESRLARELGVRVERIGSADALEAALKAGPARFLAIINPCGESFPAPTPGAWQKMLDAIRDYVNRGGCWWETGGYSFYSAVSPGGSQSIGPGGMSHLGLPVGGGDIDQPPEPLLVPPEGRRWLGDELAARVERASSTVNRALPRGLQDPGHLTLAAGEGQDFIGGYRLDGWGWLWRVGGFWPNPDAVLPVAVAAMEHVYTHPPEPVRAAGTKLLWHAVIERR